MRVSGRDRSRRQGSATLELAMILIPFLMLLMGVIEYSRFLFVKGIADSACREGARFAVVHATDRSTSDVQSQVIGKLAGQGPAISGMLISVYRVDPATGANLGSWTNARFGDGIAVRITGTYQPMIPLVNSDVIPINAISVMQCEAN